MVLDSAYVTSHLISSLETKSSCHNENGQPFARKSDQISVFAIDFPLQQLWGLALRGGPYTIAGQCQSLARSCDQRRAQSTSVPLVRKY